MISKMQLEHIIEDTLGPYTLYAAYQKNGCEFPFTVMKSNRIAGSPKSIPGLALVTIEGFGVTQDPDLVTFTGQHGNTSYLGIRGDTSIWRLV